MNNSNLRNGVVKMLSERITMCNTNKRIRGCKPNRELKTTTFRDYVIGFCEHQEHQRVEKCTDCGGSSLCEKATFEESCVRGVFVCADCGYEKTMRVDMSVLREMFDTARKGRILVE